MTLRPTALWYCIPHPFIVLSVRTVDGASTYPASLIHVPSRVLVYARHQATLPVLEQASAFISLQHASNHAIPSASERLLVPSIPSTMGVLMGPRFTMGWCLELGLEEELGHECWSPQGGRRQIMFSSMMLLAKTQ